MRIFLFSEAEKGEYCTPFRMPSLADLSEKFGNPAENSIGIDYAIQTILDGKELVFYRVHEEGFCREDYLQGTKLLENYGAKMRLSAICMPGTGDRQIIEAIAPVCQKLKAVLVLSEKDLYDYLTSVRSL